MCFTSAQHSMCSASKCMWQTKMRKSIENDGKGESNQRQEMLIFKKFSTKVRFADINRRDNGITEDK